MFFLIIAVVIILGVLSLFRQGDKDYKNLMELESMARQSPRMVLHRLQQINLQKLSDQSEALYYLLQTQCTDALGQTVKGDSLINLALDYYLAQEDSARIFQAYYLRGRIFHKAKYLIEAAGSYKYAKAYENETSDLYTKYLLNRYMGKIYHFKNMWEEEKKATLEAFDCARKLDDSVLMARASQGMAEWHRSRKDYRGEMIYLNRALEILPYNETRVMASVYKDLAENYQRQNKPDSALFFIECAEKLEVRRQKILVNHYMKAYIYFQLQRQDSAFAYLKNSLDSLDLNTRVKAYYDLYRLEAGVHRDREAYEFLRLHVLHRDSLDENQREDFLERLRGIEAYQQQRSKARTAELKLAREKIWFYRMVATSMLLIIILLIKQYKVQKKKKLLETNIQLEKQKLTEVLLEQQKAEYLLLKEQEEREKLEISKLELTVEYYKQLNDITVPILLKSQNKQGAMHLVEEEWEIIIRNTDACFEHFTERLERNYPMLDEEEIRFCCLVKMELSMTLLSEIYHIAKGSISRKKMRMKEKMNINGISFDDFIKNF